MAELIRQVGDQGADPVSLKKQYQGLETDQVRQFKQLQKRMCDLKRTPEPNRKLTLGLALQTRALHHQSGERLGAFLSGVGESHCERTDIPALTLGPMAFARL